MGIISELSSLKPRYLIVNILKPRIKPYFTNHLDKKLIYAANDGINMIIDLEENSSNFLCFKEPIPQLNDDPMVYVTLPLLGVSN